MRKSATPGKGAALFNVLPAPLNTKWRSYGTLQAYLWCQMDFGDCRLIVFCGGSGKVLGEDGIAGSPWPGNSRSAGNSGAAGKLLKHSRPGYHYLQGTPR
jgi:hypothetical protein